MGKKRKKRKNKNKGRDSTQQDTGLIAKKGQRSKYKRQGACGDKGNSQQDSENHNSNPKPLVWGKGYSLQDAGTTDRPEGESVETESRTAAQARALDRYQSICKPLKKPKVNLQHIEQILAAAEETDRVNAVKATAFFDELSNKMFTSKTAMNEYRFNYFGIPIPSPSTSNNPDLQPQSGGQHSENFKFSEVIANTHMANAALVRAQTLPKKKKRLGKTADMILAEASTEDNKEKGKNKKDSPEPIMMRTKSLQEKHPNFAAGGAGEAARIRMEGARKKKGKGVLTNETRARELLYGDALKQDEKRVFKASDGSEFQSATSRDKYETELKNQSEFLSPLEQISEYFILFVNWSEPDIMGGTTKTMLKMIDKLMGAETMEEKEKFGRLRLNNKAIIKRFVKVPYAQALLGAIGFVRATSANEDVLTFQYSEMNRKSLEFLKQCILDSQKEMAEE